MTGRAPESFPRGWGGAWLMPQHITHIEANTSMADECPIMQRLGRSGTAPVGLGKIQSSEEPEHRTSQEVEPLGERVTGPG